ncbi:hypothetical protein CPAR01_05906 [Colletotrichum paranaense]|uniref:Uncharacterized protein n=3 Tax=Colletotrichum acutatum species complex TaxID=2707335 RepID=A0AAI9XIT1_9PEZI|nr:hypothetical protein CSPX01_01639 [Colletotrichum filicis]KAK1450510.1 hypothetical protein CMEL01_07846 [Colletotrichum melonis]KAK1487862.1 hypothetical protein CCUS01_14864 [Colletotrichum cuscutae]KAK1542519.1 hypothetical protein CPAR01_05906 [Colletotrichum paranaense]
MLCAVCLASVPFLLGTNWRGKER